MGVVDVKKHLGSDPEDTSNWVDDFLNNSVATPPVTTPTTERSRPRQRLPRTPRPSSYGRGNGRKAKGSKCSRRVENASFLATLVEGDVEADSDELDITDYVSKTATVFASLFTDSKKMDIWIKFVELSETEQEEFLNNHLDRNLVTSDQTFEDEVTTGETRLPEQDAAAPSADKCFQRIEKRIRKVFSRKRIPMGVLECFEEEMLFSFTECPEAVVVSLLQSSFERLMMHGLCQYLGLSSFSDEYNGVRHMEIENKRQSFLPPNISLTQYLEENR